MLHKELTQQVINAAKAVQAELGPGLPDEFYRKALMLEFAESELTAETGCTVEVEYNGQALGELEVDFCIDDAILALLIDDDEISPDAYGFMRTLLKGLELEVGLLLNFNGARLDVRRVEVVQDKQPA